MSDDKQKGFRGWRNMTFWLALAAAIIALDQWSKEAVIRAVALYDKIPINSFINITHHRNTGAAFSMLADAGGWQRWFFSALAGLVSVIILVWIFRLRNAGQWVLSAGLSLVVGGAVGNLIDRLRFGYVTDFIQVYIGSWPFPSFNVADSAISVGAALLIIDALFISGRSAER